MIPAELSVAVAASDYFARYGYTAFPVLDARLGLLGLVTIDRLQALPPARRAMMRVAEIVDRDPALVASEDLDVARLLERPAFARVGRAVVVDTHNTPVGPVSITDVQRAIRSAQLSVPGTSSLARS